FSVSLDHPVLLSFPTRRSSDLFLILLVIDILPTIIEIFLVAAIFVFAFSPSYGLVAIVAVVVYILFILLTSEWRNRFLRAANEADRKSTRLNSSHVKISYAVFC